MRKIIAISAIFVLIGSSIFGLNWAEAEAPMTPCERAKYVRAQVYEDTGGEMPARVEAENRCSEEFSPWMRFSKKWDVCIAQVTQEVYEAREVAEELVREHCP